MISRNLWRLLWLALAGLTSSQVAMAVQFEDVSTAAGLAPEFLAEIPGGGIAVADFDGNGWPDLFVTGYFQANRLYFNQGDGTFAENAAINAQIAASRCSVVAAADYDNDGWPDVYVGCRGRSNLLLRNLDGQGFSDEIQPALDHAADGVNPPRTDALAWGDLTGNGHLDLVIGVYPNTTEPDLDDPDNLDRIVLNNGDGSWTEIAGDFTGPLRARLGRTALAIAISDLDFDGRADIYVVNDKLQGNVLWKNLGPGCAGWCFDDVATAAGASRPVFGMGIAVGDVDRDGFWDLYFSSIDEQVLLRGQGADPLLFSEDAASRLNHEVVGWATIFADFDNDGWEDAFLAANSGSFSSSTSSDQLFINNGNGTFTHATPGSGLDTVRPTEAAAVIDYDLDGRLDLVLGHWNQQPGYRLYRNISEPSGQWIGVRLVGGGPVNRQGIGARVLVDDGGPGVQMRELRAGESRGSSHQPMLHFGLGGATALVSVIWPDGLTQTLGQLPAGQYHEIHYPTNDPLFSSRFEVGEKDPQ